MKIRSMTMSDFPQSYSLWQKTPVELQVFEKEQNEVKQMIHLNPDTCLVGIHKENIIGTILGLYNGRRAWIYHLAVDPTYQKKGYGTMLLQTVEDIFHKKGVNAILLWLEYSNLANLPFYLKKDYTIYHDALALRKKLKG